MKIVTIVGARPQFIKAASFSRGIEEHNKRIVAQGLRITEILVHTGQHYDDNMSDVFFRELDLAKPDYMLDVGSGPHGEQTGEMLRQIEVVLRKERPDWVLVYGDTNSTLAGSLAAAKLLVPVAHMEAGLRSYNKRMPEEINRVMTDHLSTLLLCPTETAVQNLCKEGFSNILNKGKHIDDCKASLPKNQPPIVANIGDIMYDALLYNIDIAEKKSSILKDLKIKTSASSCVKPYTLVTVHRPENTDDSGRLRSIVEAFQTINKTQPVIWPIHPRTRHLLESRYFSLIDVNGLWLIEPVSYLDMLVLEKNAKVILTDSGGIQKEAYWLKVPCVTVRDETEWVETVESGWNKLCGADVALILECWSTFNESNPQNAFQALNGGNVAESAFKLLLGHQ